jgi:hypothetical protein
MASIKREQIDNALFQRLNSFLPSSVKTVSRRLKMWSEVPPSEQPAIFMIKRDENITRTRGLPAKVTARFDIVIYANNGGDQSVAPAGLINPVIDAVQDALEPDQTGVQDLGFAGSVSHCHISGSIQTDEGVLGDQAIVIIPVEVLWL